MPIHYMVFAIAAVLLIGFVIFFARKRRLGNHEGAADKGQDTTSGRRYNN